MISYFSLLLGQLLTWVAVAAVALYAGIVVMKYRADGASHHLDFSLDNPVWSLLQLAIWLGVKAVAACVRMGKPLLNSLLEASAEVGEWFMRRNPAVQESIRSRFLV